MGMGRRGLEGRGWKCGDGDNPEDAARGTWGCPHPASIPPQRSPDKYLPRWFKRGPSSSLRQLGWQAGGRHPVAVARGRVAAAVPAGLGTPEPPPRLARCPPPVPAAVTGP